MFENEVGIEKLPNGILRNNHSLSIELYRVYLESLVLVPIIVSGEPER